MNRIGTVESLWRYPVKSMRGEEVAKMFISFSGVHGDRLFAFRSSAGPANFPYLTARNQPAMILYRPRFRDSAKTAAPADLMVEVATPDGQTLAIDDPGLLRALGDGLDKDHHLSLLRSERAMTDCQPVSMLSLQTVQKLAEETGLPLDKRRFRANIYMNLADGQAFEEDRWVGHSLRVGSTVVVTILQRDTRCIMITIDPDNAEKTAAVLKTVAQAHQGMAGIYATVTAEGFVCPGDAVELLN
jgi:uncharacterized protein YcbX